MNTPQLPTFRKTSLTVQPHATLSRVDRSNLYAFLFFTGIFATIIAHA